LSLYHENFSPRDGHLFPITMKNLESHSFKDDHEVYGVFDEMSNDRGPIL
jgi:hypothetical protein